MADLKFAKPRPKLLSQRERKADVTAKDKAENAKVKARSGGRCEVRVEIIRNMRAIYIAATAGFETWRRCPLRASHVHHLIAGVGRRNRGVSILAAHKLHVCERCHSEIHGHVLVPVNATDREDALTVRYERVR